MIYAVITVCITINGFIKKNNKIYCLLWTLYATSAVFCCIGEITFNLSTNKGHMQTIWYDLSDTTFFGYILIVICTYIAFIPFKKYDSKNALQHFGESKHSRNIMYLFSYSYILCALLFLLIASKDILRIMNISDFGALRSTLYGNVENESTLVITNNAIAMLCLKICLQFKLISVFISFAMLKEGRRKGLAIILFVLTFIIYFINSTANASRGGLAMFVFCIILILTFFQKYLTEKMERRIKLISLVFVGITAAFFLIVSVSRFANNSSSENPILTNLIFYLGHGPIEFSKVTGSLTGLAYGGTILGRLSNHYFGTEYSWSLVQSKIGYPNIGPVFTTYLGYLYTDFGPIGCILFVSVWAYFILYLLKKRPNNFSTIFIFLYYISYYVSGAFAVGRLEYAAMITAFVGYFVLRFVERVRIRNTTV